MQFVFIGVVRVFKYRNNHDAGCAGSNMVQLILTRRKQA